jgi:hypothetical protein
MPNDGGHLLLTDAERTTLLAIEPMAERYVRRIVGTDEFLYSIPRWCLWLVNANPSELRRMPEVLRRIESVKQHRQASDRSTTQELAKTPSLFAEIRQPASQYLLIPGASSESRRYIPAGFLDADVIASNLAYCMESATLWHFGIISSAMHMAWVRTVCGRLESRYRYSNKLVYNNFPWPEDVSPQHRERVERAAQRILEARSNFLPPTGTSTLADLYDPLTMPPSLVQAHQDLDRAVDRCYQSDVFETETRRVLHLLRMYERMTQPLIPQTPVRVRRRRSAPAL